MIIDTSAAAAPFVPGGASSAIKARRLAANRKFGLAFERSILKSLGLEKSARRIESITQTASFRVPDAFAKGLLVEIKGVKRFRLTKQVEDFLKFAQQEKGKVLIVIRKDTQIDSRLKEFVENGLLFIVRAE